jgi:hypothetical protein
VAPSSALTAEVTKLIYIGGYGRSGSTLLEYLLSANPTVAACGEVSSALGRLHRKEKCTCGQLRNCPVWGSFRENASKLQGWTHRELTLALLGQLSTEYAVMVDSSKTTWGSTTAPFGFRRALGEDFRLVHIIRDPRAVYWSALKKAISEDKVRGSRSLHWSTLFGWWTANLACELFGWMYPDQYVRLRYEDLARSPRDVINGLLSCISVNGECSFESLGTGRNRHQFRGNRMRSRPLSLESIKEDVTWQANMPAPTRRLAFLLSWPLRLRYGYR